MRLDFETMAARAAYAWITAKQSAATLRYGESEFKRFAIAKTASERVKLSHDRPFRLERPD
jgi:hypothetical protein